MRIAKCVAGNYYYKHYGTYEKQMPVFVSTLTRKYYLNRNKDRDLLIRIESELETMRKDIEEIKHNIEKLLRKNKN